MPNAVFFLEPSIVSQFISLAILIELDVLRRYWRLAILFVGLIAVGASSGLLILGLAAPFVLMRQVLRIWPAIAMSVLTVGAVMMFTDLSQPYATRLDELATPGTSGHQRYTAPFVDMMDVMERDPLRMVRGDGAGSTVIDATHNTTVVTKLVGEYGVITAIVLIVLILFAIFHETPAVGLSWGVFIYFQLGGGGLATPIYTVPLVLLSSLIRVPRTASSNGGVRSEAVSQP